MCVKSKERSVYTHEKKVVVRPAAWLLLCRKGILFLCVADY